MNMKHDIFSMTDFVCHSAHFLWIKPATSLHVLYSLSNTFTLQQTVT